MGMTRLTTLGDRRTSATFTYSGSLGTRRRIPVWVAVICSRLLVLGAGVLGTVSGHPLPGWWLFDPTRLSTSLGSVGNALAGSAVRWDAIWYLGIAQHGYTSAGLTRFFPLDPLLIRVLTPAVRSPVIAGMLASLVAFAIGLIIVHRIASEEIGQRAADATVLLIAFSPLSFVFSAVYTASLLFACSAGAIYLARRGRFTLACLVASAAALTHVEGVLLVAPLALIYWTSRGRPRGLRRLWSPTLPALALPPIVLLGLLFYMHTLGWGWLAPVANQNYANAGRSLVGPPIVLFDTVKDVITDIGPMLRGVPEVSRDPFPIGVENLISLLMFTLSILTLVSAWRRLPKEYAVYAGLVIVISTSSAVAGQPLAGFDRYMLPVFPLWIGAAAWISGRGLTPAVVTLSATLLVVYTIEFTQWYTVF